MFFNASKFGNLEIAILVNLLLYLSILLIVPMVFMGIMSIFKIKVTSKKSIYLYAFSTGMFLIIGAVGFLKEGYINLENWLHTKGNRGGLQYTGGNVLLEQIIIASIAGLAALLGLGSVLLSRYLISKKNKTELHEHHEEHGHSDHLISFNDIDNPKAAWIAIIMLLSHRIIDGLVLGISVYQMTSSEIKNPNIALIVTFNLHLLLEVVITYYRQLQYGEKKSKAILFNFITLLLIVPMMFIGAFLGKYSNRVGWLMPSFEILGGSIIIFMAVIELVPEFIHYRNEGPKVIYTTLIIFAFSIVFTLILLSFHSHTNPQKIIIGSRISYFRFNKSLSLERNLWSIRLWKILL